MTTEERRGDVVPSSRAEDAANRVAGAVDRIAAWIARHWLAIFNTIVALFIAVPFMAPVLLRLGTEGGCEPCRAAGRLIYVVYSVTCHQLPERSYFLFGPQRTYTVSALEASGALPVGLNIVQRTILRFAGTPEVGYKVALCERDLAIFGSLLVGGLAFGAARNILRRRGREVPRLPLWAYVAILAPMVIDGGTQLFGLRESNWILRSITGALFGLATVWLAYPLIQEAMTDISRTNRTQQDDFARRDPRTGQNGSDML
jgi:uncharacterized membrane protein